LVGGLDEVHVEGDAILFRTVGQHGKRIVRAPMQVGGRELDLDALLVMMLRVKVPEEGDCVLGRQLKAGEMFGEQGADVGRKTLEELIVRFRNEMVLIAQREAIGNAYADVFVGPDDRLGLLLDLAGTAGEPAVQVLRGRCAGSQHFERCVKGVVVRNAVAQRDAGRESLFERLIGHAELDRRQADMVMGVDETRQ
jgi:hypothetical protein